ncbi:protein FAR1-RELATED SEQUENCE 7-like [Arachis ipaensis]|uniref:protein FAR1-RELATED SEQUENCE 7-like n=1 Tax=Arachis ipaensis TaxID=130454 RepID=UPI0007AFDA2C|nr:protein FAR1-RELATED SEQUENCE 7-like [Arachis ipaensis]
MKEKNQNFFFELELEVNQSIKIAFWANARSRAACEYFRDVILFDTTYNTNRYNLVFGSFIEVNHHRQSTLLGCALMKNEDIQLFKWLFECWLHYVEENTLKDILTDQCASMKGPLSRESEELVAILQRAYDNAMVEMQQYKAKSKEKCSLSHEDASFEDINELQNHHT